MLDAKPSDLSIMPLGICDSQLSIGRPKARHAIPRWRKCAATDSPYGPAPMIAAPKKLDLLLLNVETSRTGPGEAVFSRVPNRNRFEDFGVQAPLKLVSTRYLP